MPYSVNMRCRVGKISMFLPTPGPAAVCYMASFTFLTPSRNFISSACILVWQAPNVNVSYKHFANALMSTCHMMRHWLSPVTLTIGTGRLKNISTNDWIWKKLSERCTRDTHAPGRHGCRFSRWIAFIIVALNLPSVNALHILRGNCCQIMLH